jgi:hypothetical protein
MVQISEAGRIQAGMRGAVAGLSGEEYPDSGLAGFGGLVNGCETLHGES